MRSGLIWYLWLLAFSSCTLVVDVDVPVKEPKVTVNALFGTDSAWRVVLLNSRNILDNGPFTPADIAEVAILDQKQNIVTMLQSSDKGKGVYNSDAKPEAGKSYTIRISLPNKNATIATGTVPSAVEVLLFDIDTIFNHYNHPSVESYSVRLSLNDPPNEINFYQFFRHITATYEYVVDDPENPVRDTVMFLSLLYEDLPNKINDGYFESIVSDVDFNGRAVEIKFYPFYNTNQYTIFKSGIIVRSLSEDYYRYLNTLQLQRDTETDPFAQPVQVYGNVENGLGIFAGYSSIYLPIE